MGSIRLDTLSDFTRHSYRVRVDCRGCGRVVVIEPIELRLTCQRRGFSARLDEIGQRLRCSKCGKRGAQIGPAFGN